MKQSFTDWETAPKFLQCFISKLENTYVIFIQHSFTNQ